MTELSHSTRRELLKKMAALPLARAASPMALQLLGMANAAAQNAQDYKALVCVFLFGGNDHYNTIVPYDSDNHGHYFKIRAADANAAHSANPHYQGIALQRRHLAATRLSGAGLPSGLELALNPELGGLKTLFDSGKLGILLNSGPLVEPTTLSQYNNKSVALPPKLFSHNDQQAYWQSGQTEGATTGWGGRMADLLLSPQNKASLSCISVTGHAVFLSGAQTRSYQISPAGANTVQALRQQQLYGSKACAQTLQELITQSSPHWFENEHSNTMQRALSAYQDIATALGDTPDKKLDAHFATANLPEEANPLSAQLRMVARLLDKRNALQQTRQIFMVGLGGFDVHNGLVEQHPALLRNVNAALLEFNAALQHLGLGQQVVTFTASEFGRTLSSNGDGTDHGWGGHQLIMGGKINGGRFFGQAAPTGLDHAQQVGRGRLLPTTATDQLAAELAQWFGVSNSDITRVIPNAQRFDLHRLKLFLA